MIENWAAIAAIGLAAHYSKDSAIQDLMLWLLVIVEFYLLVVPFDSEGVYFDSYYLGLATLIAVAACICVTLIHCVGSIVLAASLSVWSIINAIMFLNLDWVYFVHSVLGDIIVVEMIGLAWFAAVRSRVD